MGISCFFRILFPFKRLVNDYFWNANLTALSFMLIPVSMYLNIKSIGLMIVLCCFFGWFQGGIYAILLALVERKFTISEDGCLLGFWASMSDIGTVFGFFMCTILFLRIFISGTFTSCLQPNVSAQTHWL